MRSSRHALLWLALPLAAMAGATQVAASPKVVATFSILGDLVAQVGGDDIRLVTLTPPGAEVHEWELTPDNFIALEDAELVFYNGYQLEQWMRQVYATVGNQAAMIPLAEASEYPTLPIVTGEYAGEPDPHLWMDPRAAAAYVQAIADALAELHPDAADNFRSRADTARETLAGLHKEITETLKDIPEGERLLITSEAAFVYFADAYGFRHDGVWGTNTETEGSPQQVMRIIDLVNESQPAALFWESTIADQHISGIASETGVAVAGPLYVDSLSKPDGEAANYISLMRHNAALIRAALLGETDSGGEKDEETTEAEDAGEEEAGKEKACEKDASKEGQAEDA